MKLSIALVFLASCATASAPDVSGDPADAGTAADAPARELDAPASPTDAARPPPDARAPTSITLTQVSTNALATNSLACTNVNATAKQAYYRVFDLAALGITTPLALSSIGFGVQSASGTQTVTVNVGTYSAAPGDTLDVGAAASDDWAAGDVTALATATASVGAAASGTIVSVPVVVAIPGGARLIVEVRSPSDTGSTSFFLGASAGSETTPGFFWAPSCGATPPGTPAELGETPAAFIITAMGSY